MATFDEILRAHDDGVITVDELFGHLLPMLALVSPETVRSRLRAAGDLEEAFDEWVAAVLSSAEVVSGGRPVHVSDEDRAALTRYREGARAARPVERRPGTPRRTGAARRST